MVAIDIEPGCVVEIDANLLLRNARGESACRDDENEDLAAVAHAAEAEDEELQEAIRQSLADGDRPPTGERPHCKNQLLLCVNLCICCFASRRF